MISETISQLLAKRAKESKASIMCDVTLETILISDPKQVPIFLYSPADQGVVLNRGRRGTSFGPSAIIKSFGKLTLTGQQTELAPKWPMVRVWTPEHESTNYQKAITDSSEAIAKVLTSKLKSCASLLHLGGGHDQIYPLLKGLESYARKVGYSKIIAINLDPHLDTRCDDFLHSGNPFRLFAKESSIEFQLIQMGTHTFANSLSTHSALSKGKMEIINHQTLQEESGNFPSLDPTFLKRAVGSGLDNALIVLSIDVDVIEAGTMQAVSAVNHCGLPLSFVGCLIRQYLALPLAHPPIMGLYEYNPLYDDLSGKGARSISYLIQHVTDR